MSFLFSILSLATPQEPAVGTMASSPGLQSAGVAMLLASAVCIAISALFNSSKFLPKALNTFSFEMLLFFELFSIFVVREKNSVPSKTLLLILIADMVLGIVLSTFGLLGLSAVPLSLTFVVVTCTAISSFVVNDLIKFLLLKKWNLVS